MSIRATAHEELTPSAISQVINACFNLHLSSSESDLWACSKAAFWFGDLQLHWVYLIGCVVHLVFEVYFLVEFYKMPYLPTVYDSCPL